MDPSIAHDKDPAATLFSPVVWQRPTGNRPFRTCSYCGSIHPEDLLDLLSMGDTLSKADEKHGWPHKFYTSEFIKFYSLHMIDAGPVFSALAAEISKTGITFVMAADGVAYRRFAKELSA